MVEKSRINKSISILWKGLLTGLILQFSIGPVFLLLLNITISNGFIFGLAGIVAATIVDYLFITAAILGLGRLLNTKRGQLVLGTIGSAILIIFGIYFFVGTMNTPLSEDQNLMKMTSLIQPFITTFVLTISSPLTIVFWTAVFATKAVELQLSKNELVVFGIGAGGATFLFLSIVLFFLGQFIPMGIVPFLNIGVSLLLIFYGLSRLYKIIKNYIVTNKKGE
ncbi:LysE family translocator [Spirochaeta cellobiosiphila]|uniref:LysE family translocator n=1 Tax=Spirochaeta cellobiosiphila TaxID=504483 RepID=UPI0003F9F9CB|nr:LysE family transporter [Spirochaeta cellobiosiphila]